MIDKMRPSRKSTAATPKSRGSAVYTKGKQRKQQILRIAMDVLAFRGYSQFTMRNIASRAGITLRNLQYYFRTKRDLFRAVVEQMILVELESARNAIASPTMTSEERFRAFIDYSIRDNESPLVSGFQFELWALATRDDFARACSDRMTSVYCEFICDLIEPLTPHLTPRERRNKSAIIQSMLQGAPLISGPHLDPKFRIRNLARKMEMEALHLLAPEGNTRAFGPA